MKDPSKKKGKKKNRLYSNVKAALDGGSGDDLIAKMKIMRQTTRPVDGEVQSAMGMLKIKRGGGGKSKKKR